VGRIISGISGANISTASAYIADVTPPEKRAAGFSIIGIAFGLGFVAGPALGGLLGKYDLRLPFLVAGSLTILNWLYGLLVLPESLAPSNRRAFSWGRSNPVGSLLALRQHPTALGLAGTHFLMYLGHQVYPAIWVLYTGYRYKWDTSQTGISLAIVGVMAAVVQGGLTRVIVRALGEQRTAILGLTVATVGYIGYGLATKPWMVYVVLIIASFSGITNPAVQSLISRNVGADEQGSVQGSLSSLSSITGILGPLLMTWLFAYFISVKAPIDAPGMPFFCSAALTLVAMLLAVRSFRKLPEKRTEPKPAPAT
jgi:DHA1 family tetracycline resistance protein-like MFS transporter